MRAERLWHPGYPILHILTWSSVQPVAIHRNVTQWEFSASSGKDVLSSKAWTIQSSRLYCNTYSNLSLICDFSKNQTLQSQRRRDKVFSERSRRPFLTILNCSKTPQHCTLVFLPGILSNPSKLGLKPENIRAVEHWVRPSNLLWNMLYDVTDKNAKLSKSEMAEWHKFVPFYFDNRPVIAKTLDEYFIQWW